MKSTAGHGGETFFNKCALAVHESCLLSTVLTCATGNRINIGFIGLAEVGGIGVGDCSIFPHPRHGNGGVQSTGKRDSHAFTYG